jgi:hypothetical protein
LLPVDNSVLHHERQGIDCRDPGPIMGMLAFHTI